MKELNRFLPTRRTDGISTTDLIVRIIKDRDMYFERSIKKGMKLDELNLKGYEGSHYLWRCIRNKIYANYITNVIEIVKKLKGNAKIKQRKLSN